MRLNCVVLLFVAALVSSVEAFLVAAELTKVNPNGPVVRVLMEDQSGIQVKRLLRAEKATEEKEDDEEERAVFGSNLISKLKNALKFKSKSKIVPVSEVLPTKLEQAIAKINADADSMAKLSKEALEQRQNYLGKLFEEFKLEKVGKNLFEGEGMKTWITARKKYNQHNGIDDTSGFETLSKYYPEKELAGMIELARMNPKTKDLANEFRAGQIAQYLREGKRSHEVYALVFAKNGEENKALWKEYLNAINHQRNRLGLSQ
uniref:RxLR effector protein n=1 Tax=Phytophthora agathidicida TaxID=1642459 RepID=A0A7G4WI49_9STRA|nr:PaRXLR60 [Phytophthora agathidicida]